MKYLIEVPIMFVCTLVGNFIALFTCEVIFGDMCASEFVKMWLESVWEFLTFIPRKIIEKRKNNEK